MNLILKFALLFGLLVCLQCVSAQDTDVHFTQREYQERPKFGLALSGGAAHGLAHIGVIKYLDELGIEIDYITGTSMGAIIGALYAMGYSGNDMQNIAADIDWDAILNENIRYSGVAPIEKFHHDKYPLNFVINGRKILLPQGIINTNRLELVLARLFSPVVGIENFEELPIPFKCYAVDIEKGEVVALENGKLPEALRASMAIPSVFAPVKYQDKWLVDGGLMRNFPVKENIAMGADIIMGSYVGREKSDISELNDLLDILSESAFMMSIKDSKIQKDNSDVLFCPDVKRLGVFDFNEYPKFIEEGYRVAKHHHEELMSVLEIQNRYQEKEEIVPVKVLEYLYIDSIRIDNIPLADKKLALDKFAFKPRTHLTYRMIERGISRIRSTLNFESVKYSIRKNNEKNILVIEAEPRAYRKLGLNVNHFSNTNSSLILSGQVRNLLFRLSNLRATLRLSDNPGAAGEYYLRGGLNSKNWILGLQGSVTKAGLKFFSEGTQRKSGFQWEGHIKPYIKYEFNNVLNISASIDLRRFDFRNQVRTNFDVTRVINSSTRYGLDLTFDNRDDRILTKKGSSFLLSVGFGEVSDDKIRYTNPDAETIIKLPMSDDFFDAEVYISSTVPIKDKVWWSISADAYYKTVPSLLDGYKIGGTTSRIERSLPFIGYVNTELMSNAHIYARSDIRIAIFEQVSLALIANAMVSSNEAMIYSDPNRNTNYLAFGSGLELGISTPLGPILLDVGYNSEAREIRGEISVGWRHFY